MTAVIGEYEGLTGTGPIEAVWAVQFGARGLTAFRLLIDMDNCLLTPILGSGEDLRGWSTGGSKLCISPRIRGNAAAVMRQIKVEEARSDYRGLYRR